METIINATLNHPKIGTREFAVLFILDTSPGRKTAEIEFMLRLDHESAVSLLRRLADKGMIHVDGDDRHPMKKKQYTLTRQGHELFAPLYR